MAEKINLNTASREELDRIPNVGSECVNRIIEMREERSGFRSLDEMKGFGEEAIRNLKQHATV